MGNNPVNWTDPSGLAGWSTLISFGYGAVKGGLALNQAYYDWQLYNALEQAITTNQSLLNQIQCEKSNSSDSNQFTMLLNMDQVATNRMETLTTQENNLLLQYGLAVSHLPETGAAKIQIKLSQ